jgi:HSP20 family protein
MKTTKGEIMAKSKESNETSRQSNQQRVASEQPRSGEQSNQLAATQQRGEGQGSEQEQQRAMSRRGQPALTLWSSPFSFMRRFGEDMDRLFADFGLSRGLVQRDMSQLAAWTPQVEVMEREGNMIVRADLPGMNPDDVQVEITDDAIILQGERRQEHEEQREGRYVSEVTYGTFYRAIPLPEGANAENARATFRDGVLEITVPVQQRESRRKQLQIESAQQTGQQQARAAGARG